MNYSGDVCLFVCCFTVLSQLFLFEVYPVVKILPEHHSHDHTEPCFPQQQWSPANLLVEPPVPTVSTCTASG